MQLGCIHSSFRPPSEVRVSAPPWGTGTALRVHSIKAISSYPDKKQRLARRTDGSAIRCCPHCGLRLVPLCVHDAGNLTQLRCDQIYRLFRQAAT
jgi:hypothetical protein